MNDDPDVRFPSTWHPRRLRWLARPRAEPTITPEEMANSEVFHYSIPAVQELGDGRLEDGDSIDSNKTLIENACVLVSKLNPRKGTVCIAQQHKAHLTVASGEFVLLRVDEHNSIRFLYYVAMSEPFRRRLEARVQSATKSHQRVRPDDILNMVWAFPSHNEQQSIVDFLDRETAQIDAMVNAQERLVALLEERRRVVIDHAVTQGLDASAQMTASGVPWIGDTPAHWTVQRIGSLGKTTIGLTYSPHDIVDDPTEGTLVLRAGNLRDGQIVLENTVYVDTPIPPPLRLKAGDIVICARSGSADLVGKSALVPDRLAGQTWGAFMTVMRSPINEYLLWVLSSSIFRRQVGLFSTSTINQLTNTTLNSMRVPVPPESEQRAITSHLANTVIRIDTLIAKAQNSIALMKERRAAVISAAVTGRLDVRTGVEEIERELEEARA